MDKKIIIDNIHKYIWRYIILISWTMVIATLCYLVLVDKENAVKVIEAFSKTTSLWEVVFNVF